MKMILMAIAVALCFTISATNALGQTVQGSVIDGQNGEKLPGANLYYQKKPSVGVITSLEGNFSLTTENSSPSDTIVISFIGYETVYIQLQQMRQLNMIRLLPAKQKIQEVIIRAERLIAEEFNVKKISQIGIYKNPSAKADPLLAVNSLPSATTTDESANVSFRGSSANETGIFLNDVPIYDAVRFSGLNGIGTFSIFNTSIIKDVVVFPGNPPLEYGNTSSGVISIYTNNKVPQQNKNSAVLSLASIGFNRSQKVNKRTGLTFFTNYSPSAAIRSLNADALRNILKFRSNDLGVHLTHNFNSKTHLTFFNYAIAEGYTFNLRSPSFQGDFDQRRVRNFSVVNVKKNWAQSSISLNGGYSLSAQDFNYSQTDIDIRNRDYFLGINYQFYGKSDDFKIGVSVDNRKQKFTGLVAQFDFAIGEEHPVVSVEANEEAPVSEVYAYYKRRVSKKLTAGAGVRKNLLFRNVSGYWSYQTNIHYQLVKSFQILIGVGQYYKTQLGRNETSNALLRSRQASIDFKYKRNRWEQSLSVFHKHNKGTNETTISGIEYYTDLKIGTKTKVQLSFNALRARIETTELTYSSPFDINPFIKGSVTREFPYGFSATSNFLWRQGTPFRPVVSATFNENLNSFEPQFAELDRQERRGNYRQINLAISKLHAISEKLTIIYFASFSNIFDFKNERSLIYNFDYSSSTSEYFSRRSFYIGASINF